jgi:putative cardiolipin synthase
MTLLFWFLGIAAVFVAASFLALYSYGRVARKARGIPSYGLPRTDSGTALDRLVCGLAQARDGASGLAFCFEPQDAFARRLSSLRAAGRSLDVASYIWRDDLSGGLLAREVIAAADRGVRVRLLLDDVNVQGFDPKFRALNGHPGIEVRLFNPVRYRRSALRRGIEMLLMAVRFNRRLHAKLWIVDGRVAITGGRNIGDDYFAAPTARKRSVRDLDLVMAGPLAERAEALFDGYWNSDQALPIAAFWRDYEAGLDRFRARLDENAEQPLARRLLAAADGTAPLPEALRWIRSARLVADPPQKALGTARERWLTAALLPEMSAATRHLRLMTPYFVPGRAGERQLADMAARGVRVRVLTNALAVTNNIIVHGAYRRYRRGLLAAGVRLFEFAPPDRDGRRGEMLHAKGFSLDGRAAFIGSFNFDLRSAYLNIELGVFFEDAELVAAFDAAFDRWVGSEESYALALDDGRLSWGPGPVQAAAPILHEPEAHALRRGTSWVVGHLPIHTHL